MDNRLQRCVDRVPFLSYLRVPPTEALQPFRPNRRSRQAIRRGMMLDQPVDRYIHISELGSTYNRRVLINITDALLHL